MMEGALQALKIYSFLTVLTRAVDLERASTCACAGIQVCACACMQMRVHTHACSTHAHMWAQVHVCACVLSEGSKGWVRRALQGEPRVSVEGQDQGHPSSEQGPIPMCHHSELWQKHGPWVPQPLGLRALVCAVATCTGRQGCWTVVGCTCRLKCAGGLAWGQAMAKTQLGLSDLTGGPGESVRVPSIPRPHPGSGVLVGSSSVSGTEGPQEGQVRCTMPSLDDLHGCLVATLPGAPGGSQLQPPPSSNI